ncbi:MAG: hypothetical protein QE487_10975 [Fluviicola sp.]|nr:hypothetical protein [Fluviicola sp.]
MEKQPTNSVLDFIAKLHAFEQEEQVFQLQQDDLFYWDIVRAKVAEKLFYTYFVNEKPIVSAGTTQQRSTIQKVKKLISWMWWLGINELNFYFFTPKRKWLFLKISRFANPKTGKSYDAVADELFEVLKSDALAVETFKNAQTDITRLRHRYQTYHLFTYRKRYAKRHFKPGKTFVVSSVISKHFPNSLGENWDDLIQTTILEYRAEVNFAKRLLRKKQPTGLFFTGGAKGFISAANQLGIETIEIQHSPLNKADIYYSYNPQIDYTHLDSLPHYLLVNSEEWKERIFYPPTFVTIGSDYFYNSSKLNLEVTERTTILFVSDPVNHDLIKQYILRFIDQNDTSDYRIVFKLHSAESDRCEEAKTAFRTHANVEVILNEQNISQLLDQSCATFIIYSTVAYQAIQKGLHVYLLKTGYYEGGYDLFDLPNVRLIDLEESIDLEEIKSEKTFEPLVFFEAFDQSKLRVFLQPFQKTDS